MSEEHVLFRNAVQGLKAGDFSRLEPLFDDSPVDGRRCRIIEWYEEGLFADERWALEEALTCACFLGRTGVADYLITRGVDPSAGTKTGLDAFHWAANRGQLETVRLLIHHKAPLETRSMYGGTVLRTAVWSALNEPRAEHMRIIEALLDAGARLDDAGYPTGNERVDEVLRRHGAAS
jgi:ankyrin repeat protein